MDDLHALSHSIVTNLHALNPLILTGVATLLFLLVLSYHSSGVWKLRQFPTVGSSLPVLSLIGMSKYVTNTHAVIAIGRQTWPGRIFKVLAPMGWFVIISDPKHLDDIRRAPDHVLSGQKVNSEVVQTRFTYKGSSNQIQIPVIKKRLPKEIPALVSGVYEEVVEACNQYIPIKDEWTSVLAFENMTTIIARAANRIFVGPVLCKNPDWIEICISFTRDVFKTALLLNIFPSFLRPIVFYFAGGKIAQCNRDGLALLKPLIDARRKGEKEERTENFNDFLTWLIDEGKGRDIEDRILTTVISGLNVAAIHTTSMAVTHVLFDLASNPEYFEPLREEVEEVTKREGWTKAALDQMCKIDSFVKESQRLRPAAVLLMAKYALQDFTFSDGTFVPAGTIISIPFDDVQLDPQTYEDPLRFDGFRFIKMKERAVLEGYPDKNFDVVSINSEFVAFGQGKHACPGRYFASAEIKLILAHIVNTYDVKLVDDARPPDLYYANTIQPSPTAKLYFRKRQ